MPPTISIILYGSRNAPEMDMEKDGDYFMNKIKKKRKIKKWDLARIIWV